MKRSMHKRLTALLLIIVMVISLFPTAVFAAKESKATDKTFDVTDYNLKWNTPSVLEDDSMPTGNGTIGMNLWTENSRDMVFYISRTGAYNNSMQTVKLGKIRVRFPENTFTDSNFTQMLNLSTGSIQVTSGDLLLEFWIDANAPVIHVKGNNQQPMDVSVTYELNWNNRPLTVLETIPENHATTEDVLLGGESDSLVWYHRNSASQWESQARARYISSAESLAIDPVKNLTFGGAIKASGMIRVDEDTLAQTGALGVDIKIDIASLQPDMPQGFVDELSKLTEASDQADYAKAYADHVAWWTDYWDNSYIEITDGTIKPPKRWKGDAADLPYVMTQNYLLQRFIQGCSMRGEHLTPFNGSIFNVQNSKNVNGIKDPDTRAWDGLPIMWQNTRAPYWSTITSGDFDQMESLIHNLYTSLPVLKEATWNRFGIEGAHMAEPMNPYGVMAGPWNASHLVGHFTATAEIPLMMVRYYQTSGNRELFQKEIMPFTEACVDFFNNNYPENDEKGKMVMYPVNSLESGEKATNPVPIIAPLRALLDELLALPSGSLTSAQVQKFVAVRNRMPGMPTREKNDVTMFNQEEKREGFYHGVDQVELYGVWPSNLQAGYLTEDLGLARQTFAARTKDWNLFQDTFNVDNTGGWNQSTIFGAKLGLPYETGYLLAQCAVNTMDRFNYPNMPMYDNGWLDSRFPAFWGPNYDWKPDQCHGGNLTNALQAMLLQYDAQGNVYLMSAWPEDWDVNFRLHAPNQTVVTATYQDGVLAYETNNGNDKITDMGAQDARIVNRVSVACADQNYKLKPLAAKPDLVGDMPDGKYDATNMDQYTVTGAWLEAYGHTLNGTVGTDLGWNDWGGATWDRKNGKLYLHLIDFDGEITIAQPNVVELGDQAVCVTNPDSAVTYSKNDTTMTIKMDTAGIDPLDTIVEISVPVAEDTDEGGGIATLVDNADAKIAYTGGWLNHTTGREKSYGGTLELAQGGGTISYTFEGTGIEVLAAKGGQFGSLKIQVDDLPAQTVSLDAGDVELFQQSVFAQHGLDAGTHTITVESLSGGAWVTFDAFVIHNSNYEMVNDNDTRITYVGKWDYQQRPAYNEYNKDIHCGYKNKGDTIAYQFSGTGIDLLMTKGGSFGSVTVSLDGSAASAPISLDSKGQVDQAVIYSNKSLPMGQHTIQVTNQGDGNYVPMDAFKVYKADSNETLLISSLVQPADISVPHGTVFDAIANLPSSVTVKGKGDKTMQVDVSWVSGDYNGNAAGLYTATGTLTLPEFVKNPKNLTATLKLIVAPKTNYVMYDDTDKAIVYTDSTTDTGSPKWLAQSGLAYGLYQGTQHQVEANNASFTFTFTGTGVDYITYMDSGRGNVGIIVDGVSKGDINLSRPSGGVDYRAYSIRNLEMKEHTIQGIKKDGKYFTVDAFKVYTGTGLSIEAVERFENVGAVTGTALADLELPETISVTLDDSSAKTFPLTGEWVGTYDANTDGAYLLRCEIDTTSDSTVNNDSGFMANILVVISETGTTTPGKIVILNESLPNGVKNEAYTQTQLRAANGQAPYTYQALGLPVGMEVTSDGLIFGTPTERGTFDVVIVVRDTEKETYYQSFALRIADYYTVTFEGNENTGGTAPIHDDVLSGASFQLPENSFEKSGYSFKGWNDGNKIWQPGDAYIMPESDAVFVAQWQRRSSGAISDTTTKTQTNADGSTSTIVTDKKTEIVVETARYADGTKVVTTTQKDGSAASVVTIANAGEKITVTIPSATKPSAGMVAVIVSADGTKKVIKSSVATAEGMRITLTEGATVELIDNTKTFQDVKPGDWYKDAVTFATSRELFNGTSASSFTPSAPMTRAMLMTVLYRLDGASVKGEGDRWYADAIAWAKEMALSDGSNPDGGITREQLATMLYRYAKPAEVAKADTSKFTDADKVSTYASEAMNWAIATGLITGKANNLLDPQGNATRAEVATMLMRFCETIAK